MHGYEMARYFDRDDLLEVCPIEQSLLYTYLRNLQERGLVTFEETRVGQRPPRKVFALTDTGREAATVWLHEPVRRLREVRLDLLLKLYFLHQLEPESELYLLREQVEICEAYHARLADRTASATGFDRIVARSRLSAAEATLRWLREYAWEVEHQPKGSN